jgi:hypothetical protein
MSPQHQIVTRNRGRPTAAITSAPSSATFPNAGRESLRWDRPPDVLDGALGRCGRPRTASQKRKARRALPGPQPGSAECWSSIIAIARLPGGCESACLWRPSRGPAALTLERFMAGRGCSGSGQRGVDRNAANLMGCRDDRRVMGARLSDAEVVRSSVAQPALFSVLYERHLRAVGRYVARRVGTGIAEDLGVCGRRSRMRSPARGRVIVRAVER